MAAVVAPPTDPRFRFFPELGAPENELLEFRDRIINPWSARRNMHMGRIGLSMAYFLGQQWSELDYTVAFDGVRGAFLRDMSDDDDISPVRPVTNKIDPMVEAEVIALVKRQWTPKVVPLGQDPRLKAAAQVAKDRLEFRLSPAQLNWREKRHQLALNFPIAGTSLLYSCYDRSYRELKPLPAPDAVACPQCPTKLYSRNVPVETLQAGIDGQPVQHLDTARDVPPSEYATDIEEARLQYCPTCPSPTPLIPYTPTPEEAESAADAFGRPLGVDVPRGETGIDVDLPFEFYPQNAGVKCTPDTLRRWGRRKIRSMEWLEERYPHLVHEVAPDPIFDLLYGDPLLGSGDLLGHYSTVYDAGIFDNNANVDELVDLPSFRYPLGRYVAASKDVVLEDSDLLESSDVDDGEGGAETVYVPRVRMSAARFKIRPDDFWGTTIADHQISKQNRLNGLDAMVIETRLREGAQNLIMPDDMWPEGGELMQSYGPGGVGKVLLFRASISNPAFTKPEVVGGKLMPPEVYQERDRIIQDMKEDAGNFAGPAQGLPMKNIGTTSGLQLTIEMDERSRGVREDELVNSVEHTWKHLLDCEWVLGADNDDFYRTREPDNTWKYEQYRGQALRGQTEVEIERGTFIAKSLVQREAAREALADRVAVIDSPVTRRRLLEMYGLDTNLNEDTSNQVDHAERVWSDFLNKRLVRVQDQIDDPFIHYMVLGAHLRTERAEKIADDYGWDEVERKIAGWEDELRIMIELEAKAIAFYGGRLGPQEGAEEFAKARLAYDQQVEVFQRQNETNQQLEAEQAQAPPLENGAAPPAPPVPALPPQAPPAPIFPPVLLQDRILIVWKHLLVKNEPPPDPNAPPPPPPGPEAALQDDPEPPYPYMEFRALVAAYKLAVAQATAGPAPAPGSGATMAPVDKGAPAAGAPATGQPPTPAATGPMPEGGPH